jgi:hypothetical protein
MKSTSCNFRIQYIPIPNIPTQEERYFVIFLSIRINLYSERYSDWQGGSESSANTGQYMVSCSYEEGVTGRSRSLQVHFAL